MPFRHQYVPPPFWTTVTTLQELHHSGPGINKDMLRWMYDTAKIADLPKEGYFGGLIHDETKIQQDVVWTKSGQSTCIVGFVDTGEDSTT